MMIATRKIPVAFLAMVGLVASAGPTSRAQEPATKPGEPAPKKTFDPSRRVPDYFGQIGLTPEQRESIYKVRKGSQEKIDALRRQIVEIEAKSMGECEAILNETQRKLLANLREAAAHPAAKPVLTIEKRETAKNPPR